MGFAFCFKIIRKMKKKILYTSQNLLNGPFFLTAETSLKIKMVVVLEWLAIPQFSILGHHMKIIQGKDIHWNNQINIFEKKNKSQKDYNFSRSYSVNPCQKPTRSNIDQIKKSGIFIFDFYLITATINYYARNMIFFD